MAPWITFRRFAQGTSIPCAPSRPKPLRGSLGAASASATNRCEACGACSHTRSVIRRFTLSGWCTSTQVENWFSKVQRHVIARGVFESVADLRRKLMRYIKAYNKTATPLQWTYSNPTNRIAA